MNALAIRAAMLVLISTVASAQETLPVAAAASPVPSPAERFASAVTFQQFVQSDTTRQQEWMRNYEQAARSVATVAPRVRAVKGRWHILVVAESWCNDAVNSVPYLARLAAENPAIELRILRKADAGELPATHLLDGRDATPLVLLYDEHFVERGAWIERPAPLRQLIASKEGRVCEDTLKETVRAWRAADDGRTVLEEVLTLLERTAAQDN